MSMSGLHGGGGESAALRVSRARAGRIRDASGSTRPEGASRPGTLICTRGKDIEMPTNAPCRPTLVSAALLALLATGADTQPMMRADADGDGLLTRAEVEAARDRLFTRLDGDGDGALSQREVAALQDRIALRRDIAMKRIGMVAARRDEDGDGVITRAEMGGGPDLFSLLDTDGDDALSMRERRRARALILGGDF
jgi:hypothetical protein